MNEKAKKLSVCLLLCAALLIVMPRSAACAEEPGWQYSETVGDFGRFVIEGLGFAVPLYSAGAEEGAAQAVCDAWDSGLYDRPSYCTVPVVADHVNQGFTVIKHCVPGETRSVIETVYGQEEFLCVAMDGSCRNTGSKLLDSAGDDINARFGVGWLVTYTCNENWEHVTVVLWRKTAGIDPLAAENWHGSMRRVRPVTARPY